MNPSTPPLPDSVDVLVIGAGISGIGAACHISQRCPHLSYLVVEARADLGGTWDLFRYPGIRSDSDLFTFGYDFKPWNSDKALASGAEIKAYIAETAREHGVTAHLKFEHRVVDANWSSTDRCWQVTLRRGATGALHNISAKWLFNGTGYYRYDQGYAPEFPGQDQFKGRVVHPQDWPEELDYSDQRVVVIGSGATAVTLLPAMAEQARHITMLQRTPSYVMPIPSKDRLARRLRPLLGPKWAHAITRRANIAQGALFFRFCQSFPNAARRLIRNLNAKMLPPGYPVDVHFNPPYNPWEQRLCAVPGGDLFKVISAGKASIETDHIERFTADGILLRSGKHLPADLIVTATGLNLLPLGGLPLRVDGEAVNPAEHVIFKGMLLSDVPNFATAVGYTSSSWTLKIGLICEHLCRLLNHMNECGVDVCTPRVPPGLKTEPLLNFGAGYVQRSASTLPRQGTAFPWTMSWSYASDARVFRKGRVDDPALEFLVSRQRGERS